MVRESTYSRALGIEVGRALLLGRGFPFLLFRLLDGFTVPPWLTFPKPYNPGRPDFRVRFETLAFFRRSSQVWRGLNAGPYTPPPFWFASSLAPWPVVALRRFYQAGRHTAKEAAKCPEPLAQLRCYLRWGDVSVISSEGVTPPSSLLRAHVPLPLGSLLLRHLASFESPGRLYAVPAAHGSFPTLSLRIFPWMLDPVPRRFHRVLLPVSSPVSSAFPQRRWGRLPASTPRITTSRGTVFRGCRYFLMFRPPSLLTPQIVPTAAYTGAGQPGLLRPGLSCFVTSTRTGYANRPNTGN